MLQEKMSVPLLLAASSFVLTSVGSAVTRAGCRRDIEGSPPGWVFAVVWPLLFVLLALAGMRLWVMRGTGRRIAFVTICTLLALYPLIAWGYCSQVGGLLVITATLIVSILLNIALFAKDVCAGILLLPLTLWLAYALILTVRGLKQTMDT